MRLSPRFGVRGVRWRLAALLAVAVTGGTLLTAVSTGPAAAVTVAPPQPGATPAVEALDVVGAAGFFYTGTDGHAYAVGVTSPGAASLGGRLIGGPGVSGGVFGRGTDSALWQLSATSGTWQSIGGRLTSRPGAASGNVRISGHRNDVVVRGTDGAVWLRVRTEAGRLLPWQSLGGRVLAGSGPAAVSVNGTLYALAAGTDRAVWAKHSADGTHWSGWQSLGGRVSGDLGAAAPALGEQLPAVGVVFARGADNAAWFNEFTGTTAGVTRGWHSLGGRLSSGTGAVSNPGVATTPGMTHVVAMGTDNHIWEAAEIGRAHV